MNMVRKIIFYENHFIEFYQNQNEKVKSKIQYVFELIKQVERVPEKFLKHLEGTEGLYEIRVEFQSNIFRIFFYLFLTNISCLLVSSRAYNLSHQPLDVPIMLFKINR